MLTPATTDVGILLMNNTSTRFKNERAHERTANERTTVEEFCVLRRADGVLSE